MIMCGCHFALDNMPGKKVKSSKMNRKSRGKTPGYAPTTLITSKRTVVFPYPQNSGLGEAAPLAGFAWTYRLNSLFDPDFTGTGVQPMGFDQFSALYGRYAVTRAKFDVTFANTTSLPIRVGYVISPQSTLPSNSAVWSMLPFSRSKTLGAVGSGKDVIQLNGSTSFYNEFGLTKRQFQDEADFSASTSASPARILYLHVYTFGLTAAGNATCNSFTRLSMTAELSQAVSQTYS